MSQLRVEAEANARAAPEVVWALVSEGRGRCLWS